MRFAYRLLQRRSKRIVDMVAEQLSLWEKGKMPTTSVRRLSSPTNRSSGLGASAVLTVSEAAATGRDKGDDRSRRP
jgi:hypothetical protein